MNSSKLSSIFILFVVAHLNLAMPVSRASNGGDICIMESGIYMAHHSDNQKIHDHRGQDNHHKHHQKKGIHQIKMDCSMDMSSSALYFPGGEHPFTYAASQDLSLNLIVIENIAFAQSHIREGFITPPYNPPKSIS